MAVIILGEPNTNGAAVTRLLVVKKQDDEAGEKELQKMITAEAENYLYHPAINHWTVRFRSSKAERQYHQHFTEDIADGRLEFVLPHFNSLLDMIVVLIFFSLVSVCCFIAFEVRFPLVIVFVVAMVLELFLVVLMLLNVFKAKENGGGHEKLRTFLSSWYPRHLLAGFIACFPTLAVFSTFLCNSFVSGTPKTDLFYCLLVIGSLANYCNFTLLSSWMKTSLAAVVSIVFFILLGTEFCGEYPTPGCELGNSTNCVVVNGVNVTEAPKPLFWSRQPLMYEVIIDTLLLLLLLFFINREIEISYRVCFHGDIEAARNKKKMRTEEDQANWLLHNIVPQHVAEHLKLNSKYSKTHKDIGVIFAKIVNFEDFYDESFEGGKEYLRVLNELMGDFEELFDDPKYRDIEKIKTIGSCLMAASGLNPQFANEDPDAALCALMDFSYDLLHKLEQFNKEIFNFDFEMSIGYNFGEVTAGVVGTTKLLYDIWGDTVNIASRMYSTGVHGRIQVTEDTAVRLKDHFDFEPRGQVFVKGKGDMNVFLLAEKRKQDRKP